MDMERIAGSAAAVRNLYRTCR